VGSFAELNRLSHWVEVGDLQHSDFGAGGTMQQGEHAHQGLVRVDVLVGGPAAEELTLLIEGECPAAEAVRLLRGQIPCRVDQDEVLRASEAEELPQDDQPALAGLGQRGQEGFDVMHVGQGPVVLAAVLSEEESKVPEDAQGSFQSVIAAGTGAGPPCPVLGPHAGDVEGANGWPERVGDGIDAALAPPGGEPFGLVSGQGQAAMGEEVLESTGEGSHRPSWSPGPFQQGLG
jgi:hypothetical protein